MSRARTRDVVVLNAAAGLVVGRPRRRPRCRASALAGATIDSGRAAAALDRVVTVSQAARTAES